jgi:hypothetical protein
MGYVKLVIMFNYQSFLSDEPPPDIDVDKLLTVGNFDRVVIVERRNLVDCCISLCLAEQKSKTDFEQKLIIHDGQSTIWNRIRKIKLGFPDWEKD